jgi:hypothetical protein
MLGVPVYVWIRWTKTRGHTEIVPFEEAMVLPTTRKQPVRM